MMEDAAREFEGALELGLDGELLDLAGLGRVHQPEAELPGLAVVGGRDLGLEAQEILPVVVCEAHVAAHGVEVLSQHARRSLLREVFGEPEAALGALEHAADGGLDRQLEIERQVRPEGARVEPAQPLRVVAAHAVARQGREEPAVGEHHGAFPEGGLDDGLGALREVRGIE